MTPPSRLGAAVALVTLGGATVARTFPPPLTLGGAMVGFRAPVVAGAAATAAAAAGVEALTDGRADCRGGGNSGGDAGANMTAGAVTLLGVTAADDDGVDADVTGGGVSHTVPAPPPPPPLPHATASAGDGGEATHT